ncbi:MAG: hypothetical protein U5K81_11365 [Trueperaceae bacterium]|nr:hypothetical protein [Trueperaceae bacterium]
MDTRRRAGVLLVLIGALFLLVRIWDGFAWPLIVIVVGLALVTAALIGPRRNARLAVPGAITATVGAILALQDATGTFDTWSYAWGLVLASVGVGTFLQASIENRADGQREGLRLAGTGLTLFAAFGAFFELFVFDDVLQGVGGWVVPLLLIGAGAWMLMRRSAQ